MQPLHVAHQPVAAPANVLPTVLPTHSTNVPWIWLNIPKAEKKDAGAVSAAGAQWDTEEMQWCVPLMMVQTTRCERWMWPNPMMAYWYGDVRISAEHAPHVAAGFMKYMKENTTIFFGDVPREHADDPMYWLTVVGNDRGRALCGHCRKMRRSVRHPPDRSCGPCRKMRHYRYDNHQNVAIATELVARSSVDELKKMCADTGTRTYVGVCRPWMAMQLVNHVGPGPARLLLSAAEPTIGS